jgi:hypothetical protein
MVEGVTTLALVAVAVTAGARATRNAPRGRRSATGTTPRPAYRVVWDPPTTTIRRTPGPLVYIVREWDDDVPMPEVKIGWTGRAGRGAAATRIGDWETGTRYPTRVEALIPGAPQSLERALHKALAGDRTSSKREWFTADRADPEWRTIVEATATTHKEQA